MPLHPPSSGPSQVSFTKKEHILQGFTGIKHGLLDREDASIIKKKKNSCRLIKASECYNLVCEFAIMFLPIHVVFLEECILN